LICCSLHHPRLPSFPTRRSSDLSLPPCGGGSGWGLWNTQAFPLPRPSPARGEGEEVGRKTNAHASGLWQMLSGAGVFRRPPLVRSEEHTSELQSRFDLVGRLLLE